MKFGSLEKQIFQFKLRKPSKREIKKKQQTNGISSNSLILFKKWRENIYFTVEFNLFQ